MFAHTIPFAPEDAAAVLEQASSAPAVFALEFGEGRESYISQTTDLRRRLRRVLAPDGALSKRLNLLPYLRSIAWTPVGSAFESWLVMYRASRDAYGPANARKRLRLRPPAFLRFSESNAFPRLYVSHKLSRAGAASSFGPFSSRAAAERCQDSVLDLFQLRRCYEDLHPYPEHPGCVYGEIHKCLAPCKQACAPERYAQEASAVFDFLRTRGKSLLDQLAAERAAASEALEFEAAAHLHGRHERASAVIQELPECTRQISTFAAILVLPSAEPDAVSLFSLSSRKGALKGLPEIAGPVPFSTLGMRLPNERSGSSSLFAHPVAMEAVPLEAAPVAIASPDALDQRLAETLENLTAQPLPAFEAEDSGDQLALFARWCVRPQTQRTGEALFADPLTGELPRKALLRAIARTASSRLDLEGARTARPANR